MSPVFVNAALQFGIGTCEFGRVRVRVIHAGAMGGYGVNMLVVGFFATAGEDFVVREDIVLGMATDPGTARLELEIMLRTELEIFVPNCAEMGLHHSLFGLADGEVETFGFAVAMG
jgi:hypothetical protein